MARNRITIDDPDDEILPASPGRRRRRAILGCLTLIVLLGVLVWFAVTHTETFQNPGLFGF